MSEDLEKPYRSIREVSEAMGVKAHVLRYWETQFSMLRPRKNRAGVRMYRPKDLDVLREIRHLLYDRGFTIAGARRKLLTERKGEEAETPGGQQEFELERSHEPILREIRKELAELHALMSAPPAKRQPPH
ncbi:MAG: MerR family transcriptional regulator [Candidatus Eisenbacteria bacterium]|nr:MerR family transcriptional regulator [Candidatus Eisenbacteria bacterium]